MTFLHFFRNSEAFASEFLENLEELFPQYYKRNDVCNMFLINCDACLRVNSDHFTEDNSKLLIRIILIKIIELFYDDQ